jgi:hypothetical protein
MRYSKKKRNIRNRKRVVSTKRLQKAGYSKKKRIQNSRKNKKILSRKRQKGGGALNSIMSMVPFMSSNNDVEFDDYGVNQDADETQNVLVSALCNQYLKNNIRGTIKSEYDPVLDSLCAGANISSLPRNNAMNNFSSNSIGIKSKRSKKKPSKPVKLSQKSDVEAVEGSQSGGVKLPSFLGGIKGLASFYSMPLRTGMKAVNSGINTIKEYSSKKKSEKSESESSSNTSSTPTSKKEHKTKESGSSGSSGSSSDIDTDIERAEAEILKETSSNNEARDEVVNSLTDNKNLDIKEVIKK